MKKCLALLLALVMLLSLAACGAEKPVETQPVVQQQGSSEKATEPAKVEEVKPERRVQKTPGRRAETPNYKVVKQGE